MFQSLEIVEPGSARVLVLGHFQGEKPDDRTATSAARLGVGNALTGAAARAEATGEVGVIVEAYPGGEGPWERVLLVGLGKKDGFTAETVRSAAAAVGRRLATVKATSATVDFDGVLKAVGMNPRDAGAAFGEALGLLSWVCDQFRGKGSTETIRSPLAVSTGSKPFDAGLRRGLAIAQATNFTRTLSQTPPNVATPYWMAEQAQKLAKEHGMTCKVTKGAELVKEKMTGLVAVGAASENAPCLIRLEYDPTGAGTQKPVVLVGKTVCYDTGGLSLKINNSMVGMKRDKDGGCAVLGAMLAIASVVKPKRRVVAFLVAAENSISDEAYRPDDVLRYRNGVTVEVTNTDAEGRLVLADALSYACEVENPAYIIDLATLTGGVITALGSTYCGMFCEDERLRTRVEAAAAATGERVWRLPMHQEYRDMMKSPVADIVNSNPNRKAHPIQGAAFLSYFVDDKVPWCHLDIAGVHVAEKNAGMFIEGPTGWGVRLLAELLS